MHCHASQSNLQNGTVRSDQFTFCFFRFGVLTVQKTESNRTEVAMASQIYETALLSLGLGLNCGVDIQKHAVLGIQLMSYLSVWLNEWTQFIYADGENSEYPFLFVCVTITLRPKSLSVNLNPSTSRRLWMLFFSSLHFGRFDLVLDCKLIFVFILKKKKKTYRRHLSPASRVIAMSYDSIVLTIVRSVRRSF